MLFASLLISESLCLFSWVVSSKFYSKLQFAIMNNSIDMIYDTSSSWQITSVSSHITIWDPFSWHGLTLIRA